MKESSPSASDEHSQTGQARTSRSNGCSTLRKRESSGKERRLLSLRLSVRLQLGTYRPGGDVLLESSYSNHATTLAVRADDDVVGNESLHTTVQRRTSLLADSNTARLYPIQKNQAISVERTF